MSGQSQNPDAVIVTDLAGITHTFSQLLKKVGVLASGADVFICPLELKKSWTIPLV